MYFLINLFFVHLDKVVHRFHVKQLLITNK